MRALVTYFEPFNKRRINNSKNIALELKRINPNLDLIELPVIYDECFSFLKKHLESSNGYDFILSLGESSKDSIIRIETRSENLDNCKIKDNAGELRENRKIDEEASDFLILENIPKIKKSYLFYYSKSIGNFVCNNLAFHCQRNLKTPYFFIHIPSICNEFKNREFAKFIDLSFF